MEPVHIITFAYAMALYFFVVGLAREWYYEPLMAARVISAQRDTLRLPRLRGIVVRSYAMQRWSVVVAIVSTLGLIVGNSPLVEVALVLDVIAIIVYRLHARRRR